MTAPDVDVAAVLDGLKDFQQRTARWAFERMFAEHAPATRFLVADEVGLGKTHVAKGVVAQVIDHLRHTGDERHDIVYICSNGAIARQNVRKLVPEGIAPLDSVDRLTMLPLVRLDAGDGRRKGINLLAITPGTSLKFGRSTGTYRERFLAYAFLRAVWGSDVMDNPVARRVFWHGITVDPEGRLRWYAEHYRSAAERSADHFAKELEALDSSRVERDRPTMRALFDELAEGLAADGPFPGHLYWPRRRLIANLRRIMATVGIAALQPDLVILDEFQRFKDLLRPDPRHFAAHLAHRMFNYADPATGRATRTLLLSATPYRMYTTGDEIDADHYADFYETCAFLLQDEARTEALRESFRDLRLALTSAESLGRAEEICAEIAGELSGVMARTERLAATPDRDGMLHEPPDEVAVEAHDLRAYLRFGDLAEAVRHYEPAEYWKSAPYLVNFMEGYKLKEAIRAAAAEGRFNDGAVLAAGPGMLTWEDVEAYDAIDPQNGRLRWLLDDLNRHRAFELLWLPASLRYYDAGSAYESPEAAGFTKRLLFSGWVVVPKVVSSLVSFEAERRAYAGRDHPYGAEYAKRGGQRLTFRTAKRAAGSATADDPAEDRRAAAMTTFLLVWPSLSLAELGNPRPSAGGARPDVATVLGDARKRIEDALEPLRREAQESGAVDQRWYWAAPLLLDKLRCPEATDRLLAWWNVSHWEGEQADSGLRMHLDEARAMLAPDARALGRPPEDLARVLAELAVGGPAQCALRAIGSVAGLGLDHESVSFGALQVARAFRSFFNAPEVTGLVVGQEPEEPDEPEALEDLDQPDDSTPEGSSGRYWRQVVRHAVAGNLQAVLDEHAHVLREWRGFVHLSGDGRRAKAAGDIAHCMAEALELRTSTFRVDIPAPKTDGEGIGLQAHRMRTRFAVAYGNQALDEGGEVRAESVSRAFNSPFWPFVLASTSVGQEGLDFHLWCHAVVHWNLPANPVDLEQREGRVHRFKGHAVRRNIAATLGADLLADGLAAGEDPWDRLFAAAAAHSRTADGEMAPYWVFHEGPARIERHAPVMPFSRDAAALPRLRKALAAYRLAFGQPRQEELVEFLGADRSDSELAALAAKLRIDLSPPAAP